jgi:hypothetical protein
MNSRSTLRSGIAALMVVLGGLQAWDSNALSSGLPIILMVGTAIILPAILFLMPSWMTYFIGSIILSLVLLVIARIISPIPLPGLFLVLLPAGTGLIYIGILEQKVKEP